LEKAQNIYIPVQDDQQKGTIQVGGMAIHAGEHGEEHGAENI
jgi:hypothetical protein